VRFCDVQKTLVEEDKTTIQAQTALVIDWWRVFGNDDELPVSVVHERLQKIYDCQKRRAQQYVEDGVSAGEIISEGNGRARKISVAIKTGEKIENNGETIEYE
jgi:hypothetical protein